MHFIRKRNVMYVELEKGQEREQSEVRRWIIWTNNIVVVMSLELI